MMNNLQMLNRWYILKGKVDKRDSKSLAELYLDLMGKRIHLDPRRLP